MAADRVIWVKEGNSTLEEEGEILLGSDDSDTTAEHDTTNIEPQVSSRLTCYLTTVASFSAIGGFIFGYDTDVISGALLVLDKDYNYTLTALQKELLVSITIGAAALGTVIGGPINEWLGRKPTMIIASAIFVIGALIMAGAPISTWGWTIILVGRFIVGIGIGLTSMTVPMYLAECSPLQLRGRLTVFVNMAINCGQFVAGVVDFCFSYTVQGWRYMLGLVAIPSLVGLIAFFFLPESPRWLVGKGKKEKARIVLTKLRGKDTGDDSISRELQEIATNVQKTARENQKNIFSKLWIMLNHRHLRIALIIGCGLQAIQQLSGVNTLLYYSPTILKMAGVEDEHIAIGLGAVISFGNFIFTLVGVYCVERFGRRKLILSSLSGVILSLVILSIAFYLAHTATHAACPTDTCSLNTCDDCVIQDSCFYCLFPSNDSYNEGDTPIGYCINRQWTTNEGTCQVPSGLSFNNDSSCDLISNNNNNNNNTQYGQVHSSCPNKYSWLAMGALVMYIVSFAPGMGPVPWTVNAEIYPNWARSTGNSLSSTTNWTSNLLVSVTFLHLTRYLTRYGAFGLYVCLALAGWIFIFLLLPETKGRSLEEMEVLFKGPACPPAELNTCQNKPQQTPYNKLTIES